VRALIGVDIPTPHNHIIGNAYEAGLGRRRVPYLLVDLRRKSKVVTTQHVSESLHRMILKVAKLKLLSKKPGVGIQQNYSRLDATNEILRSGLVVVRRFSFAIFVIVMSGIQQRYVDLKELLVNVDKKDLWRGSSGKAILTTRGIFEYG
jgi:hypothetical protein